MCGERGRISGVLSVLGGMPGGISRPPYRDHTHRKPTLAHYDLTCYIIHEAEFPIGWSCKEIGLFQ